MNWAEQWGDTALASLREMGLIVAGFVPKLLGVIVILALGYAVSRVLQRVASALLKRIGFDLAAQKSGLAAILERGHVTIDASALVGKVVFWLFMLTFLLSAADTLGLDNVSQTIDSFVAYLPNVIGAAVILVVGLLLANLLRGLVRTSAAGIGLDYSSAIANAIFGLTVVVVGSLAITQLKLETTLINQVLLVFLVSTGAAVAMTLGFGTREVTRNLISGIYAREVFDPGMKISMDGLNGAVREVGTVNTVIVTDEGDQLFVPNGHLMQQVVRATSRGRINES